MGKRFQMTPQRHNIELALGVLKKQLGVTKNPSEISRIEGEITELQKLLTFGTRKEKKWS